MLAFTNWHLEIPVLKKKKLFWLGWNWDGAGPETWNLRPFAAVLASGQSCPPAMEYKETGGVV